MKLIDKSSLFVNKIQLSHEHFPKTCCNGVNVFILLGLLCSRTEEVNTIWKKTKPAGEAWHKTDAVFIGLIKTGRRGE